jgi:hypothetical protein
LFLWGALSDERMGLSFVCAAGPCQRSLSWVLIPWDLRPYFTVSDLRLPFSSPPTTCRVTVEVFDPATTQVYWQLTYQLSLYSPHMDHIENISYIISCSLNAGETCVHSFPSNGSRTVACLHSCYLSIGLHAPLYYVLYCMGVLEIGYSPNDWVQLTSLFAWEQRESSLRNVILNKNRMMDTFVFAMYCFKKFKGTFCNPALVQDSSHHCRHILFSVKTAIWNNFLGTSKR